MAYADGRQAKAICMMCGFTVKYTDLRDYIFNQIPTGLRVGKCCYDKDNPQLQVGKYNRTPEAIALYKPSIDVGQQSSTSFWGFNPVCSLTMQYTLTPPTVTT